MQDAAIIWDPSEDVFLVDITGNRALEAGAFILASMIHPQRKDGKARTDTMRYVYAAMVRDRTSRDRAWAIAEQSLRPEYIFVDESSIRSRFQTIQVILKRRTAAGKMALPFLAREESGVAPVLPKAITELRLAEMARVVSVVLDLKDAENMMERVWRPALPVIHLCAAAELILLKGAPVLPALERFADAGFLETLLAQAKHFEQFIGPRPLAIQPYRLVRFRVLPQLN